MMALEHEAKSILRRYDVSIPEGEVISSDSQPILPRVLKAQVPVGGRGKAGGIKVVRSEKEWGDAYSHISQLDIKGHTPSAIYAEELIDIKREFYLSLTINRDAGNIELIAHPEGGVDIEAQDQSRLYRQAVTDKSIASHGQSLADHLEIPELYNALADLLSRLYDCFTKEDATLLEINPLVLTGDGDLVAADCKLELDEAAMFRHPDRQLSQGLADANFVTLDELGTVATMANGAGLAMATVDAVTSSGHRPANFLDIGGTATVGSISAAFEQMAVFTKVQTIIINIFGGIVRCDTVAEAIIAAKDTLPADVRLAVRLSGNRSEEANRLLQTHGISSYDSLEEILEELS